MTKRKRYSKPANQKTIASFFAGPSATSAVEDGQFSKRQRLESLGSAAVGNQTGEGGEAEPPMTVRAEPSASPPTQTTQAAVETAGPTDSVTVNMAEFEREKAARRARFVSTKCKHKYGWEKAWLKKYKWLVPVTNEDGEVVGMLCSTCRRHNQRQRSGEYYWSKEPVSSLRSDMVGGHPTSTQHEAAVQKDKARLAAAVTGGIAQAFQRVVSVQGEALTKAMKVLYFLAKEEIPHTTKFSSLLDFSKDHLGCDVLSHLNQGGNANYRSERILQELLKVMAGQIQEQHEALLQESTFYGLQCDETTDITTTKELVLLTRLITNTGEVANRFARMIPVPDGKADTITAAILSWLQEKGLDLNNLKGFGSDGASVMTGRRNGVATLLKGHSSQMVAIHCTAHRLALAVSQAGDSVPYFKHSFKANLGSLFRFYDYSACRTARFRQIQEMMNLDQLTLKEAKDTRWLSHDLACKALYESLPAVIISLDHEAKQNGNAVASGLLKWLKSYKTLATLYLLCAVLPQLTSLSLCFQQSKVNLLEIHRVVETTVEVVSGMREGTASGRLSKLEQDLAAGGRLAQFSISVSPELKLQWQREVREPFIDHLLENLQDRFASTQLLSSFAILDPSLVPDDPMNEEYGCAEVQCLATQYGGEVNGIVDPVALDDEWLSLRTYMRRGKGHLSQEQLVRSLLTDATLALLYPNMRLLASVLMVIPVSTADSERSFSTLKRIKTRLRSRLSNAVLNDLLTISIDGPHVNDFDFARAVTKWAGLKNRRIIV
ncbi:zinc finger protein 862-like [Branchiostoma floridae]|uniref:Zinc finger protein 862-like n=1 Tax=Branchiostoma floridae TaxID=7739 RepID=A0A9J7MZ24_BRAFL|nr:zinc finger protein 862-like [Branchiostoma floridae]